jgi:hypothetical protein
VLQCPDQHDDLPNADSHSHPNADSHSHPNADSHSHPNADSHSDTHSNSDQYGERGLFVGDDDDGQRHFEPAVLQQHEHADGCLDDRLVGLGLDHDREQRIVYRGPIGGHRPDRHIDRFLDGVRCERVE